MKLFDALSARFPHGLDYEDARQMCIAIHSVKNTLPSDCREFAGEKVEIANAFSGLVRAGLVRTPSGGEIDCWDILDSGHWLDAIQSCYRSGDDIDMSFPQRYRDIFPSSAG